MEKYEICSFDVYGREPVIRKMKNGTLVCLFLTGGPKEPHNDNIVAISRSYDDGATWSKPETLFSHSARGVWSPELFAEGEYPFIVVNTYCAESVYRELQTFISYSYDNGESWSEPKSFPGGLNGVSMRQGILLSNGAYLFPIYWQETTYDFDWKNRTDALHPGEERFPFRCGVAISEDQGKSYQRYGYLHENYGLWEPNCIELENGHILMYMRSNGCPFLKKSESFDYGKTWSEPVQTDLPNPNTKPTLVKIRNSILLINNFYDKIGWENRKKLQIHISDDYCRTWRYALSVDDDSKCFFYPHAFADDSKEILYLAYENARQHYLKKIAYHELGL